MDHEPQADNSQSRGMFWAMGTIYSSLQPTEHTTHVESALPYLQLATCPLVHLFMPHEPRRPSAKARTANILGK